MRTLSAHARRFTFVFLLLELHAYTSNEKPNCRIHTPRFFAKHWHVRRRVAAAHAMPMQTSPANGPSAVIAPPALDLASLAQFVDPLPISEIAWPAALRPSPADAALKIPYYRLAMRQFETKIHRDVKPTRVWGFGNSSPGPTIEARKDQALLVEWANELSATHLFPIDHSIHG